MMLDDRAKILILEIRHNQKHQVSFTAIDLASGSVIWDGLEFEESWWVGMTAITHGVLILHTYVDNADPEPKGLIAFDVYKQEVRWMHENFSFLRLAEQKVVGINTDDDDKRYETIELTGGRREAVEESIVLDVKENPEGHKLAHYPYHYKEGSAYFDTCKTFLYNRLHLQAVNAIEYLEVNHWIVISYYVHDEGLVNYLLIIDENGEIYLHEAIQKNINAVGLETFFIVENHLIFVKDKNEIFCYNL